MVLRRGYTPQQLCWVIMVLIPNGGNDYLGIGLLKLIWMVIEAVMDQQLNVVEFNDALHSFRSSWGTGVAITEVKLDQQMAYLK